MLLGPGIWTKSSAHCWIVEDGGAEGRCSFQNEKQENHQLGSDREKSVNLDRQETIGQSLVGAGRSK
jgi:hypothetical protein